MKNWKRKIAAWLLAAAVMCTSAALPSVVSAEGNGTDSGTSTTNGPTTKAYEGPEIPAEPAETDPSVYTTKEEALAALEEAQQKYKPAYTICG